MATWRELIKDETDARNNDVIIASTLTEEQLDQQFDDGYGGSEGIPFTAWSETRVYFPVVYDGKEWVGSLPRNPSDEVTYYQGSQ